MKQKLLLMLLLLIRGMQSACAQEPYVVLSEENTKLTFYYDDQKESRGGLSVEPFKIENHNYFRWEGARGIIQTVIFDTSFANCTSITSTARWFNRLKSLTKIEGIENLKTVNVTDMSGMFANCISLKNLDLSHFNTSNVINMSGMFSDLKGSESMTSLDLSNFDTSKVTDMSEMFAESTALKSINLNGFNTSNVTNMECMFGECTSLTSLDLSSFKTSNVTNMEDMFRDCTSLTSLDLSSFNTSNVTNMERMFRNCASLTSLDLSTFDISKITDFLKTADLSRYSSRGAGYLFSGCTSLTTIYVSDKWSVPVQTHLPQWGEQMFFGCTSLIGGQGTKYDEAHVDYTYARIDRGAEAPGYFTSKSSETGIKRTITEDKKSSAIYNLHGQQLAAPQKGINIVGGKKVVVK